jgi:hypothetical protein
MFNRDKEKGNAKVPYPMDARSQFQMEYGAKESNYKLVKPTRPKTASGPFTGKSSYGQNYKKWDMANQQEIIKPAAYKNTMPFKAHSSYKDNYGEKHVAKMQDFNPKHSGKM